MGTFLNNIGQFFSEGASRIKSNTPAWFKKLGNMGVGLGAAGGAMITPEIVGAHMPDMVVKVGGHLLTAGAIIKAVSHFAVDNGNSSSNTPPTSGSAQ